MKLHNLSRRDRFYNEGGVYKLIPVYRAQVVPGQSVHIRSRVKVQTGTFTKNILSDALASVFFFYVPHRLVWEDWPSFISQDDDFAGTFPVTAQNWALVFDRNNQPDSFSALYRRAYKLVYNQFFGDEGYSVGSAKSWYADITADSNTDENDLKNSEQFTGRAIAEGEIDRPTFDATTTPIDLIDFDVAMRNMRSARRAQMSGDKYVDALRRMGVEPDWRIQQAPEFLGRLDQDVSPVKVFNTTGTTLGDSVARYEYTLDFQTKGKKMFAEHGYIVGVTCLRPHVFNDAADIPPDGRAQTVEDFWTGDNARIMDDWNARYICGTGGDTFHTERFSYLRDGVHLYGASDTWVPTFVSSTNFEAAIFLDGGKLPISDELGTNELAIHAATHMQGATPVPPQQF